MDISFIIPVYNDKERIKNCIDSVKNQVSSKKIEIIVIDDCSNKETKDILINISDIILIRNSANKGQSYSRNLGAKVAKGEYLFFIDSDVIIPNNSIENSFKFLDTNEIENVGGVLGTFALHSDFPNMVSNIYNVIQNIQTSAPDYANSVNTSCFLIKRSIFEKLSGFNEQLWYMEDDEFGRRCVNEGVVFKRNLVFFRHYKIVKPIWMLRQHFIGGMQLNNLNKFTTLSKKVDKEYSNNFFQKQLLLSLYLLFLAPLSINSLIFLIGITCYFFINYKNISTLFKVRKNIIFIVMGVGYFHMVPILISLGFLYAKMFKVDLVSKNRDEWLYSNQRM